MMFTIIAKYNLSIDYFFANIAKDRVSNEINKILDAFGQSMVDSPSKKPSLSKISQIANVSQIDIEKHFSTFDDLIYAFINRVDQSIVKNVEEKMAESKDLKAIFIFELAPSLYEKHFELNLLYTRPYISGIWVKFINNRYKRIILNNLEIQKSDSLTLEYFVTILTTMVSTWMSQDNPESLEKFQKRIEHLSKHEINEWLLIK